MFIFAGKSRLLTYASIVKNELACLMVCTIDLCTYRLVRIRNKCSVKLDAGPSKQKQCHFSVLLSLVSRLGVCFWWTFTLCLSIFSRVSCNIIIMVYGTYGKWHGWCDCSVTFVERVQNRNASPQHQVDNHALEKLGWATTCNEIPCLSKMCSIVKMLVVFWGPEVLSFPLYFYLIKNPLCSWW